MARPTDLTPDMSARICDRLRVGLPKVHAALASGTTETSFHNWYRQGKDEGPDSDSIFRRFYDDVNQAMSEAVQRFQTLQAQNANGYDIVESETHDVIAMKKRRYKDERGNWVTEEEPVKFTLTSTKRKSERDTKAPMDWLKRRDRDNYGDRITQEHSGPNGGPISVSEVVIEMPPADPEVE